MSGKRRKHLMDRWHPFCLGDATCKHLCLTCEMIMSMTACVACRSVSFAFGTASGNGGNIKFECALSSGDQKNTTADFSACSSPLQYSDLADGQYQFYVRAQGEEIADSRAFTKVCS